MTSILLGLFLCILIVVYIQNIQKRGGSMINTLFTTLLGLILCTLGIVVCVNGIEDDYSNLCITGAFLILASVVVFVAELLPIQDEKKRWKRMLAWGSAAVAVHGIYVFLWGAPVDAIMLVTLAIVFLMSMSERFRQWRLSKKAEKSVENQNSGGGKNSGNGAQKERVKRREKEKQEASEFLFCESCGVYFKAPVRYCEKCGSKLVQAEK